MAKKTKKKPNVVPSRCEVCRLTYTGESTLTGEAVRQGMSNQESLKFVKQYKLKCLRCGRGSWTTEPPPQPRNGPNIALLDAVEDQLAGGGMQKEHGYPVLAKS